MQARRRPEVAEVHGCRGKHQFSSWAAAAQAARAIRSRYRRTDRRGQRRTDAYRCAFCGSFHVGKSRRRRRAEAGGGGVSSRRAARGPWRGSERYDRVAPRPFRVLSLCAGVGGLDLGIRLAVPGARTVCMVEREIYAAAVLVTRMHDGSLDDCPVWSDAATFDGRPWRGVVDCATLGVPCQPWSAAGKRLGAADDRWIWADLYRVVREVQPEYVFLEEVRGFLRGGLGLVIRDLADAGYRFTYDLFSAAEVGAPHKRERLFVLAHRRRPGRQQDTRGAHGDEGADEGRPEVHGHLAAGSGADVAHRDCGGREGRPEHDRRPGRPGQPPPRRGDADGRHPDVALPDGAVTERLEGRRPRRGDTSRAGSHDQPPGSGIGVDGAARGVFHASGTGRQAGRDELPRAAGGGVGYAEDRERGLRRAAGERPFPPRGPDGELADASGVSGRGGIERPEPNAVRELPLFPPGPAALKQWRELLRERPDLAPAVESPIRGVADGFPDWLDRVLAHRAQQLRALGNGVVPTCAAVAFLELHRRLTGRWVP